MEQDSLKNNTFVWVAIVLLIINIMAFVGMRFIVSKVTDRVIEKLQKEYSPSPYSPGFDPDKVDPDALRRQVMFFNEEDPMHKKRLEQSIKDTDQWRNSWESERGVSF